jgi:hypothetical protein
MFTLFLVAVNVATLVMGLVHKKEEKPNDRDKKDDHDNFIPCC